MSRRKSPSQKIPRNHSDRAIPSHSNQYETDENGNPKIASGPLTCFSYRTMEKQYEKDTQRMLERIQKSRSFEQQQKQQSRQQEGTFRTNEDGSAQRSVSLKDLSSIQNDVSRNLYYDGGFYIGDEGDDYHQHNDYDNSYIDHDDYQHLDHQHQQEQHFEEQEEIFELDL